MKYASASLVFVLLLSVGQSLRAQDPPFHDELFPPLRSTFRVPRTRPWDWSWHKYFGGGPVYKCPGHPPCRSASWSCHHWNEPFIPPTWTVDADALLLRREREDGLTLLTRTTDDAVLLDVYELGFDYQPGPRISLQYHLDPGHSIEVGYFTVEEWKSGAVIDDADPIQFQGAGVTIISADPFETTYRTQLQSGECNFRKDYYGLLSLMAGFRWLEINEEFWTRTTGDEVFLDTHNKMFGLQFGAESKGWVDIGILRIDSFIKGGVYLNQMEHDARRLAATATKDADHPAWVGEAAVTFIAPATKHIFLRGGYQLLHVAGIATARDQLVTTDLSVPVAAIDTGGTAIYHGFHIGIEAWW